MSHRTAFENFAPSILRVYHRDKEAFWSAVMLGIPGFKGHPMGAHLRLGDEITPPMFERWLLLWRETTAECFTEEPAAALQGRAEQIGRNFQLALFGPSVLPSVVS